MTRVLDRWDMRGSRQGTHDATNSGWELVRVAKTVGSGASADETRRGTVYSWVRRCVVRDRAIAAILATPLSSVDELVLLHSQASEIRAR